MQLFGRIGCIIVGLCFCLTPIKAQQSFSEEKDVFYQQVITSLNALGTEPAKKVAFDFGNVWTGNMTTEQQDMVHSIALQMQQKGYYFRPHFWYYFSYLAFAVTQRGVIQPELTEILKINNQVVKTMTQEEYTEFLLGMSTFMAREILSSTKNLSVRVEGGSHTYQLRDAPLPEETSVTEILPDEEEVIDESEITIQDWSNPPAASDEDPWADNATPWGTDNSWDSGTSDSWDAATTDSWDSGTSDSWDSPTYASATPQLQEVISLGHNYVTEKKSKYVYPKVDGPVIEMLNKSMILATRYDSFKIREFSGSFLLKNRVLAGTKAIISWPEGNHNFSGATVLLKEFHIGRDRVDFWTPNAELSFPSLFSGSIEGYFSFTSVPRKAGQRSSSPIFVSYHSDHQLNFPGGRISYTGGVKLSGNALYGTSVSKNRSRLEILDGKGNKIILRAQEFIFLDSTVISDDAAVTIFHGSDSVYHPSVSLNYDQKKDEVILLRTKKFKTSAFHSTYFEMDVSADLLKWTLGSDSLHFSILNGKDLVPATIESDEFYNDIRFARLNGFFSFHPIITSVYFSNKYATRQFNVEQFAAEFPNQNLDLAHAKSAMKWLDQYGFAQYDELTGIVTLNDKAFFYYKAKDRKIDYDNVMIPSIEPAGPNITWHLDSGYLLARGVSRFYLTSDFLIYAEPFGEEVKVRKGKDIEFNGMVNAGEFQYKGKEFRFSYDDFLINLTHIDSIRIQIKTPDSLKTDFTEDKMGLSNHLTMTSGVLYLDRADNKSGKDDYGSYPSFNSDSDAIVYFDSKEILNGAYDRSVRFVMPPFNVDSLEQSETRSFEGKFISGGIFPEFDETLEIMPDQSLGFVHDIPTEGYNLYGTEAKTYEKITLNNRGIRGGGKIDFITTTIYSPNFIYYPDSVSAYGTSGVIRPGEKNGASYPEATLGPYKMHWLPRVDSMYLQNIGQPFKFYHATAQLYGEANVSSMGVFGSGKMLTRGSEVRSQYLRFREHSYSARHAKFAVLTNNPLKPAMAGDDISLNFDLINNVADISPERAGVAAISFPFSQMKTSITNAVWNLADSTVTMTKPPNVPIERSYFYSTRPELDSLAFNAEGAFYDFNTYELRVEGIPYIKVADAKIIPENHQTVILENSELQNFQNAEIILDTLHGYHHLTEGHIKIFSRNRFEGNATYQLEARGKTYPITFENFTLENVPVGNGNTRPMTVSSGTIPGEQNVIIDDGFYYKGNVKMYAAIEALELEGFIKLDLKEEGYNRWIKFKRTDGNPQIRLKYDDAVYEDDRPVIAGLHYDLRGNLYATLAGERKTPDDEDFFLPEGILTYDTLSGSYKIETPAKTSGESYEGFSFIYNDATEDVLFEGIGHFFDPAAKNVDVTASILGTGNNSRETFEADAFFVFDMANTESFMPLMAADLVDVVERLGAPPANDLSIEMMYKFSNITSDQTAKLYETESLKEYKPLFEFSPDLIRSLVISSVKMKWSNKHKAWFNTTKLGVSHAYKSDINAKLDGFLELKKDEANQDVMNLFIQAAPGIWYFFGYQSGTLMMFSSNPVFNDAVEAKSNYGRAKPNELVTVLGDQNETLSFLNGFLEKYFGVTEPYNLVYPEEISLEEENFETIEKEEEKPKEDDGFGF